MPILMENLTEIDHAGEIGVTECWPANQISWNHQEALKND
jgi:hypothetical protein